MTNKKIFLIAIFCILFANRLLSQQDTLSVVYNKSAYERTAKKKIKSENYTHIYVIPIYKLKSNVKYICGDNLENLIDFKNTPDLQLVFIDNNTHKKHEYIIISDALRDTSRYPSFYQYVFNPVSFKSRKIQNNIVKYMQNNKSDHVFMILDFTGCWTINNGSIYKLTPGLFKKINKVNANKDFLKYGEKLINNIIKGKGMGVCITYNECKKSFIFNKVFVKINVAE